MHICLIGVSFSAEGGNASWTLINTSGWQTSLAGIGKAIDTVFAVKNINKGCPNAWPHDNLIKQRRRNEWILLATGRHNDSA